MSTWWLIPLSKWVITPVISGLTLLIPFITGVITHLLSGMSHQVSTLVDLGIQYTQYTQYTVFFANMIDMCEAVQPKMWQDQPSTLIQRADEKPI